MSLSGQERSATTPHALTRKVKRHKAEAEWFESQITKPGRVLNQIVNLLWPGRLSQDVFLLTTGNSSGIRPQSPEIALWDGSVIGV